VRFSPPGVDFVPASTPSDVAPLIMNFIWQYQVFKESFAKDTLERQNINADFQT
jgi:hypothetical protein